MPESITISDLDEATVAWIEEQAKRRGMKKENIALNLIHRGIECEREHMALPTFDDMDSLAGTWSDEQSTELLNAISYFEQVDEKLWQ